MNDHICVYVDEYLGPCSDPAEFMVTATCEDHLTDWQIGEAELCTEHILEVMEIWHSDDDHNVQWLLRDLRPRNET